MSFTKFQNAQNVYILYTLIALEVCGAKCIQPATNAYQSVHIDFNACALQMCEQ